jgi:hypothetical protein
MKSQTLILELAPSNALVSGSKTRSYHASSALFFARRSRLLAPPLPLRLINTCLRPRAGSVTANQGHPHCSQVSGVARQSTCLFRPLAASGTGADHLRDQRSSAGGLACQWRELWVAGAYQAIVQRQPVPGLGVYICARCQSENTDCPALITRQNLIEIKIFKGH